MLSRLIFDVLKPTKHININHAIFFRFSQYCCREMDLFHDLLEKNLEILKKAEEKGKFSEAINYCNNIIKLKQKLNGTKYPTQYEELMKLGSLYYSVKDYENSLHSYENSLSFLKGKENLLVLELEIYQKLANINKEYEKYEESRKYFEIALKTSELISMNSKKSEDFVKSLEISLQYTQLLTKIQDFPKAHQLSQKTIQNIKDFLNANETQDENLKEKIKGYILLFLNY